MVEELIEPPKKSLWTRFPGAIKMLKYLQSADEVIAAFNQKAKQFQSPTSESSEEIATALNVAQTFYSETMDVHIQSSAASGVATNTLQSLISEGQESTLEKQATEANLMPDSSGVESAMLVEPLDHIIVQIAEHKNTATNFIEASQALPWLKPSKILIAPITDIGWAPYFSMISGLLIDIGSSLSHGAVIARESMACQRLSIRVWQLSALKLAIRYI